ncbi:MAG TPA: ABC transporter permease subunit [Alphaproteobacteria bacterium]|jgi:polar amino acid transport system permease protein|nr:ABC transporter permease subunit [Alphaproteobacteria bacterium]
MLGGFGPQLLAGAAVTVELALGALVLGLILGLLGAAAKLSPHRWISRPVTLLLNLLRGVPEFLILLIVYFGAAQLVGDDLAPGPFGAGVFALGIVFGAYASETFRGGFLAVPAGPVEAARAFGMSPTQTFFLVRLPQAWRVALPGIGNLWQGLIKDTSLVSVVGLEELIRKANIAAQVTKDPFPFYLAAMAIYLAIVTLSNPLFAWAERRANRGMAR